MSQSSSSQSLSIVRSWNAFFHEPEVPYALALVRIVTPWVLMLAAWPRWFFSRELYSLDGLPTPFWDSFSTPQFLPVLPPQLAVALYSCLLVSLVMVSLGWMTRTSLAICLVLYPYFGMIDMISTMTKYTVVATHLLLLLLCSNCGNVWSIDAWLENRGHSTGPASLTSSPRWPRRLIQLLTGIVYFGAAITKFHTDHFLTGDHLTYWMLSDLNHPHPLGHWLSLRPALVMTTAHLTIIWEVLFLFLAWRGWYRWAMLSVGIVFHLVTIFTLGLWVFPGLYLTCYLAFLEEDEARWLGNTLAKGVQYLLPVSSVTQLLPRVIPEWTRISAFGVILTLTSLLGVEAEARLDLYDARRPEGPHILEPLPPDQARELLRNDLNMAPRDKVLRIDVGNQLYGGILADHKTVYRAGDELMLQCTLIPTHEDLWIELRLINSEHVELDRLGQVCPREEVRSLFKYKVSSAWPPGTYELQVRLNGTPVGSQQIIVKE